METPEKRRTLNVDSNLPPLVADYNSRPARPEGAAIEGREALNLGRSTCVCRILDSAVLVVEASEDRSRCNGAEPLNDAMERRVLVQ